MYILQKDEIIFPESLHYQHFPPTFMWDALCQSCETVCWNLGVLIACYVSARYPQSSILGEYPSGGQEVGSWSVLNWACKEDEEQQATPLLQLPLLCADLCAVWHYNAGGLYSFPCLARPFNFVVLTSFMTALIALNWLWHSVKHFNWQDPFTDPEDSSQDSTCSSLPLALVLHYPP